MQLAQNCHQSVTLIRKNLMRVFGFIALSWFVPLQAIFLDEVV
jgi:hypothetical protein